MIFMSLLELVDQEKTPNQEQTTFDDNFEEVSKEFETTEEELKELRAYGEFQTASDSTEHRR